MKRRAAGIALVVSLTLGFAWPSMASADHTHVLHTGNGDCVVLAANGGEKAVELPDAVFDSNPNVDAPKTPNKNHPLHVLVHQGVPGEQLRIQVLGSDTCADFVGQP